MRLMPALAAISLAAAPAAAWSQAVDRNMINRIIDQGMNQSEVMETAAWLADRIGGRLTNSPQMRAAEQWTQQRFRSWGLSNVRAEGFEFGRGWSIASHSSRMLNPRLLTLRSIPVAWTPPTNGTIAADIVVAPMDEVSDFARWRGQLRGKIVLITRPTPGSEPTEPAFRRLTEDELRQRNTYQQANYSPLQIQRTLERADFAERLDAFLAEEGALAWVRQSYRDGGLVHGAGYPIARAALRASQASKWPRKIIAVSPASRGPTPRRASRSRATSDSTTRTSTPIISWPTCPEAIRARAVSWPAPISIHGSQPTAPWTMRRARRW